MLEISYNSTSIARGCWKKYYWHYVEGLTPTRKNLNLTLGTIMHKAFELFYTGMDDKDVLTYIITSYNEELAKTDPYDREDMEISKYTAVGMWQHYPYKDRSEYIENYAEKEFEIPLDGMHGVRFKGKVDGLVNLKDKWWVRELKTSGLTPRQFAGRMATSAQSTGYVYAMRKLGYDVQGVLYEVIKKPRLYKRQDDTCDTYGQRIMADYKTDASLAEGHRTMYSRHFIYRSPLQIKQYLEDTKNLVKDIRRHLKKKDWYRNMDQCWNFNTLCPYSRICFDEKPDPLTVDLFFERKDFKKDIEDIRKGGP